MINFCFKYRVRLFILFSIYIIGIHSNEIKPINFTCQIHTNSTQSECFQENIFLFLINFEEKSIIQKLLKVQHQLCVFIKCSSYAMPSQENFLSPELFSWHLMNTVCHK